MVVSPHDALYIVLSNTIKTSADDKIATVRTSLHQFNSLSVLYQTVASLLYIVWFIKKNEFIFSLDVTKNQTYLWLEIPLNSMRCYDYSTRTKLNKIMSTE